MTKTAHICMFSQHIVYSLCKLENKMMKSILVMIMTIVCLLSCTTSKNTVNDKSVESLQKVLFAVNNDGIYLYNYSDNQTKKVCDIKKLFIPKTLEYVNDSLILIGEDVTLNSSDEHNYLFYNINLKSGGYKKYKLISYAKGESTSTSIKTLYYSETGNILSQIDTILECDNLSSKYKGIRYCNVDVYAVENSPKTQKVFSKRGSLYISNNEGERNILEYTGNFSRRISPGYFSPSLSDDTKKVVYRYKAPLLDPNSGIYEVDVETGNQNLIADDAGYFDPRYSSDGEFLLLGKNKRQSESGGWIEDFFLYKIKSNYALKLGEGNNYTWIK